MKPNIRRTVDTLILLAVCGFLGGCCTLCKKCPESLECEPSWSNAATGIKSSAGGTAPTADTSGLSTRDTSLSEGWSVSYPLFEGDYFTVTLPTMPDSPAPGGAHSNRLGAPVISAPHPGELIRLTDSSGAVDPVVVHSEVLAEIGEEIALPESIGGVIEVAPSDLAEIRLLLARRAVADTIRHMGFSDPTGGDVLTGEFFGAGPHIVKSGGGDILEVARINCEMGLQPDSSFCDLNPAGQMQLIKRATGMEAHEYLDRELLRYYFFQRPQYRQWPADSSSTEKACVDVPAPGSGCRDVFIEHTGVTATSRLNGGVTSINGRIFPSYKITNRKKLDPEKAIRKAYKHLWKIPGISKHPDQPIVEPDPSLVLLPYAHARRFDLGRILEMKWPSYKTPQLRYAYRTTLWGNYVDEQNRHMEAASWRAWVDAETGDILQLFPQFAFATTTSSKCEDTVTTKCATGKGWPVSPSYKVTSEAVPVPPTEREFKIDEVTAFQKYRLKLTNVIDEVKFEGDVLQTDPDCAGRQPTFKPLNEVVLSSDTKDFAANLGCTDTWDCICNKADDLTAVNYLLMNAYAHVFAYKEKLDAAICKNSQGESLDIYPICVAGVFQAAKNESEDYVPLQILIGGDDSWGRYKATSTKPHLTFAETEHAFISKCACNDMNPNPVVGWRPGAQDATLMTHEFAHVIMGSLNDDWCEPTGCPVPLGSGIVHDLSDGLSAVSNFIGSFGKWRGNTDIDSEAEGSYRKFNYQVDNFPEHRRTWQNIRIKSDPKAYADGQIAAAALWEVTQSMDGWLNTAGPAAFEVQLLNVLATHSFHPYVCPYTLRGEDCDSPDKCDLDVYRYLHFLLSDLINDNRTTRRTETDNKIIAGFAKAGIFLVPPRCIGGSTDAENPDPSDHYCLDGQEYGGDAVIDIGDNWLNYNPLVTIPFESEFDLPKFEVWTGPRFRFKDGFTAEAVDAPPCNQEYKITIANNSGFDDRPSQNYLCKDTAWLNTGGKCQATWPAQGDWTSQWNDFWEAILNIARYPALGPNPDINGVYYRVVTRDASGNELSSSENPGKLFTGEHFDPPFAVLNDTGEQQPELVSDDFFSIDPQNID